MSAVSGIYCMYFEELYGKYYIGLSCNINSRKLAHLNMLRNNKHINNLLQNAYNNYGEPVFSVVEFCSVAELSNKEIYWINAFEAYTEGFNKTTGGELLYGENHPRATSTNEVYIKVLFDIANSTATLKDISIDNDISYDAVRDIACGKSHKYLETLYPEEYSKMLAKAGTRTPNIYLGNKYTEVVTTIATTNLNLREVSDLLGIGYQIVRNIAYGSSHTRLSVEMPIEYDLMRNKIRKNIGGKWQTIQ